MASHLGGQQVITGEPSRRKIVKIVAKVAKMPIVLTKTVQGECRMFDVQGVTRDLMARRA